MTRRGFVGKLLASLTALSLIGKRALGGEQPCYLMWDGERTHEVWEEDGIIPEPVLKRYPYVWRAQGEETSPYRLLPEGREIFLGAPCPIAIRGDNGAWSCHWMFCAPVSKETVEVGSRKAAEAWLRATPYPYLESRREGRKVIGIDHKTKTVTFS